MASEKVGLDGIGKETDAVHTNPIHTESDFPVGDSKELKVLSVELTDALAKDQPNYKSKRQLQLMGFMLFATMSKLSYPAVWPCFDLEAWHIRPFRVTRHQHADFSLLQTVSCLGTMALS